MSWGYSSIVSKLRKDSFRNWLNFINQNFNLSDSVKVRVINQKGDTIELSIESIDTYYREHKVIMLRIRNNLNNAVSCTFEESEDASYCFEEYSLEELLSSSEEDDLFKILHERYLNLHNMRMAIGFIFDKEGYSEDYIFFKK